MICQIARVISGENNGRQHEKGTPTLQWLFCRLASASCCWSESPDAFIL